MTRQLRETISQHSETWRRVLDEAPAVLQSMGSLLWEAPFQFCGCGSSYFGAQTLASLQRSAREVRGLSADSRAEPGAEYTPIPGWTSLFITRSGTTTEVVQAMAAARKAGSRTVLISGAAGSPAGELADVEILLDYASDPGVIQARFITSTVLLWRWLTGGPAEREALSLLPQEWDDGAATLDLARAAAQEHFVTLGGGWRKGLAGAAGLCLLETARLHTEHWHPLEYRHGPMACADNRTFLAILEPASPALDALVQGLRATGAQIWAPWHLDPLVRLIALQRLACEAADLRGIDADVPRNLVRSVQLNG